MAERWKSVVGFEGLYEVSDRGRVRSSRNGRVLSTKARSDGYVHVGLSRAGRRKGTYVHILVLEAFKGLAPPDTTCAHANGHRGDNALLNLSWNTQQANCADKVAHGTHQYGALVGTAKLSDCSVRKAKQLNLNGLSHRAIGALLGVSKTAIGYALRGKTWTHVR